MRVLATILLAFLALTASAGAREKPAPAPASAGQWIVTYDRSAGSVDAETSARERIRGFRARLRFRHALRGFAARLTPAQVAALRADPEVASVVPDRPRHALGQTVPFGVRRIGAATTSVVHGASSTSVAVVDTGVDLDHPDLDVAPAVNCVGGASSDDDHGHGTHVAGTIGARNGAGGVVGVAPGTKVHAVKVLDGEGSGSDASVICGLDWVTANAAARGIGVVNMSLGGLGAYSTCGEDSDPFHEAVCRTVGAGVAVVVAAGNDGWDLGASPPDTPAWYPEVLTVTAMGDGDGLAGGLGTLCDSGNSDDVAADFSNFALAAGDAAHMIAGPGVCVQSTYEGGGTATMSGTSMASPHVAGLVALCLGEGGAAGPCAGLSPAQIVAKLRADAAQAAGQGFGFGGDPAHPIADTDPPFGERFYGNLARAATAGSVALGQDGAPPAPAPEPAPAPAPPLPAPSVTTPPATTPPVAAPARRCWVHVHVRRHVHRRVHLHRLAGRVVRRHVHRRTHVHRPRHTHCTG